MARLFSFHGRVNRLRYSLFAIAALIALLLLLAAFYAYALSTTNYENGGPTPMPGDPLGTAAAIAWVLAIIALVFAALAMTVRRLHDRGKSWYWLLLFLVLPNLLYAAGEALKEMEAGEDAMFLCGFFSIALSLWAFAELFFMRGTAGANRFGPDPLAIQASL